MANNKSAKKRILQNEKRRLINKSRFSSVRTAIKKVIIAVDEKQPAAEVTLLFNDAQSKIARAQGKGLLHKNTAARKVSRLAKYMTREVVEVVAKKAAPAAKKAVATEKKVASTVKKAAPAAKKVVATEKKTVAKKK